MKKILALIMVALMCFSLCACAQSLEDPYETEEPVETRSIEEIVEEEVENAIYARIVFGYQDCYVDDISTQIIQTSENTYEVSGRVTVRDLHNYSYIGRYDAEVECIEENGKISCDVDLDMSDLYKR